MLLCFLVLLPVVFSCFQKHDPYHHHSKVARVKDKTGGKRFDVSMTPHGVFVSYNHLHPEQAVDLPTVPISQNYDNGSPHLSGPYMINGYNGGTLDFIHGKLNAPFTELHNEDDYADFKPASSQQHIDADLYNHFDSHSDQHQQENSLNAPDSRDEIDLHYHQPSHHDNEHENESAERRHFNPLNEHMNFREQLFHPNHADELHAAIHDHQHEYHKQFNEYFDHPLSSTNQGYEQIAPGNLDHFHTRPHLHYDDFNEAPGNHFHSGPYFDDYSNLPPYHMKPYLHYGGDGNHFDDYHFRGFDLHNDPHDTANVGNNFWHQNIYPLLQDHLTGKIPISHRFPPHVGVKGQVPSSFLTPYGFIEGNINDFSQRDLVIAPEKVIETIDRLRRRKKKKNKTQVHKKLKSKWKGKTIRNKNTRKHGETGGTEKREKDSKRNKAAEGETNASQVRELLETINKFDSDLKNDSTQTKQANFIDVSADKENTAKREENEHNKRNKFESGVMRAVIPMKKKFTNVKHPIKSD